MRRLICLVLAMVAPLEALHAAESSTQTAFFCLLGKVDSSGTRSGQPQSLNVLLGGHPNDPSSPSPVTTYDPAKLLESEKFLTFLPGPQNAPGYIVVTRVLSDKGGFLLSLTPIQGQGGRYDASLGRRGNKPGLMGQCFGPVGPISEAQFLADSRQEPQ